MSSGVKPNHTNTINIYSIVFHIRWMSFPRFSIWWHWAKCETETPIDGGHFAAEFMRVHEEGPPTYDKYLERISISVCVVHARRFEDCAFDRYTLPPKQRSSCCAMNRIKFCIHAITCPVVRPKIARYQNILVHALLPIHRATTASIFNMFTTNIFHK